MEYIENQIFYHIQREKNGLNSELWNEQEVQFIGQKKNRFFEAFDFLNARYSIEQPESIQNALNHTQKIIRELVFEEVRKEFFPSHPSRQRCLWVIRADEENSLNYWKEELGHYDRILKVNLTGKIHRANQEFLHLTTDNLNVIRQRAFHYWTGTTGRSPEEEEILFEGFAEVLEIIE
jgi:hypothetical protein